MPSLIHFHDGISHFQAQAEGRIVTVRMMACGEYDNESWEPRDDVLWFKNWDFVTCFACIAAAGGKAL